MTTTTTRSSTILDKNFELNGTSYRADAETHALVCKYGNRALSNEPGCAEVFAALMILGQKSGQIVAA